MNIIGLFECYWWQFVAIKDSGSENLGVFSLDLLFGGGI